MQVKKLSAVALSALMATTAMLPMSAFAQQTPSVEYTGGDGSNITHLYLIADDDNLATNYGDQDGEHAPALNAKVQVPVAINYVAQANGNITGPADEAAQIRNFSGFPVNVANIKVNAGTNVTLVNTAEAADTADEIYLQMKPNSGTVLFLADFTTGTGARPTAGEWNIAAAVSGVGTEDAVPSALNINALSGTIGGFNNLDPAQKTEIGQIEWTVKPGTLQTPPTLPASAAAVSSTSLSDLSAVSRYLATGQADEAYVTAAESLVGGTITVTLADNETQMTARLVDVDAGAGKHGLTFEAIDCLPTKSATGTNWGESQLRTKLNSTDLYTTYFENTQLDTYVREVSNSSFIYNDGNGGSISSSDRYFVPCANNIYGAGWPDSFNATNERTAIGDVTEHQFDYYRLMDDPAAIDATAPSDDRLVKNVSGTASAWWLRSGSPASSHNVMFVGNTGYLLGNKSSGSRGVAPCFCL